MMMVGAKPLQQVLPLPRQNPEVPPQCHVMCGITALGDGPKHKPGTVPSAIPIKTTHF